MKPIMRKVPILRGVSATMAEFLEFVQCCELEVEMDSGGIWPISLDDVPTIKYKGKTIDIKDLKIQFEMTND